MIRLAACVCALMLAASSSMAQPQTADAAGSPPQSAGSPGLYNLAPFSNITSCLPFNILIAPSSSTTAHTLITSVSPEVEAALRIAVTNNTLYLGFNKSFETTGPIKITVTLPASKLQVVENKGAGSVIINPGR